LSPYCWQWGTKLLEVEHNTMMTMTSRRGRTVAALAAGLILFAGVAEARMGGGRGGFGSRGARTYSPPPATRTAPETAAPIQRSQIPQSQLQNRAGTPGAQAAQPGRFGGFGGGLMAGLLGAGLLGMLFGGGFFGGLGGLASFLGLMLQIGLVVFLASMALKWFRRRQEPAPAGAYQRTSEPGGSVPPTGATGGGLGGALGGMGLGRGLGGRGLGGLGLGGSQGHDAPRRSGKPDEVGIVEADFAAFERALVEMQDAYSRRDIEAVWSLATPEMAGYIQEELSESAEAGKVRSATDVRLLQGDLSEAWREGATDYATVAMRFSMIELVRDKASGAVLEGDPDKPAEATELWTFRRDNGGPWKLSAIQ
jgi:predicted lipid-binding transport protein (Tim44 family)